MNYSIPDNIQPVLKATLQHLSNPETIQQKRLQARKDKDYTDCVEHSKTVIECASAGCKQYYICLPGSYERDREYFDNYFIPLYKKMFPDCKINLLMLPSGFTNYRFGNSDPINQFSKENKAAYQTAFQRHYSEYKNSSFPLNRTEHWLEIDWS